MNKNNSKFNIERGCLFTDPVSSSSHCGVEVEGKPSSSKLASHDWLSEFGFPMQCDIIEVKFKNTRRGFYSNINNLPLKRGDVVVVEAAPGHDVGIVSMTGELVKHQMRRTGFRSEGLEFKKLYRKAKAYDIEKWQEAISLEHRTMIESRIIASDLNLNMKIGDVEYQGDRLKAIFYYIADERVDFRELIKIFADRFKIRIEMKQIGARQEAGRIGGIGSCGRELCCSKFIANFVSVTTNSARFQEILLNPQKLAGQCGKLKCCMNYEVDAYIDARREFPKINEPLESIDSKYFLVKSDIFKKEMTFSTDPVVMANVVTISARRAWEVLKLNRRGVKVDQLSDVVIEKIDSPDFKNVVGEESITRFDSAKGERKTRGQRKAGAKRGNGDRSSNRRNDADTGEENKRPQRQNRVVNGDGEGRKSQQAERRQNNSDENRKNGSENSRKKGSENSRKNGEQRTNRNRQNTPKEDATKVGVGNVEREAKTPRTEGERSNNNNNRRRNFNRNQKPRANRENEQKGDTKKDQ